MFSSKISLSIPQHEAILHLASLNEFNNIDIKIDLHSIEELVFCVICGFPL